MIVGQTIGPYTIIAKLAAAGIISTVPAGGGDVRELTRGNGIAPDPLGRFLVIDRQDAAGAQMLRRDSNGTETLIKLPVGMRATGLSVWPTSLDARGRLLFVGETDDSWFWGPAVLDLQTLQATRIPITYAGDAEVSAAWDGDDHITVLARRTESTIWRFERIQ